ncbi:hypothetical protein TNCV_1586511 [Trichonephila clavipes]|nr:hypothetical protein TNCV_1586511 [Trichonephila clavipes]
MIGYWLASSESLRSTTIETSGDSDEPKDRTGYNSIVSSFQMNPGSAFNIMVSVIVTGVMEERLHVTYF